MSLKSSIGIPILAFTSLLSLSLPAHGQYEAPELSLTSSPSTSSVVTTNERALIVVINLSIQAKHFKPLYRREEKRALKKILKNLGAYYGKLTIYSDRDATRVNLLKAIEKYENDPSIRAIDTIMYIHGKNETLGFVDTPGYYPSAKLKDDILSIKNSHGESPKKLRMLYSDACYGALHMKDWVGAGYRVASGSPKEDNNWSMDLKKFMKGWKNGETFSHSIRRANRVIVSPLMDLIMGGNSYKYVLGDTTVTLDSSVE